MSGDYTESGESIYSKEGSASGSLPVLWEHFTDLKAVLESLTTRKYDYSVHIAMNSTDMDVQVDFNRGELSGETHDRDCSGRRAKDDWNVKYNIISQPDGEGVKRVAASNAAQHLHDLTTEPHRHDFAELVIITAGNGVQVVDGGEYAVSLGDVFLIQGNGAHYFLERNRVSMINVLYDPARLPLPFGWLRRLPGYNVIFELEPSVRSAETFKHHLKLSAAELAEAVEIVGKLERELEQDTPGAELAAFQRLLELIVFISRCYDAPPAENLAAVMRVGRIISLLESEFMREWRLEELAKLAATSPNNLLRLFRTVTGTSPVDYLIRVRLRRAAEALKNTPGAVAEIAADCGFADSNYFARKFRAAYGVSPREFRKRPL